MVTKRKKKVDPANDIPVLATDAKSVMRKKATVYPKVVKGTHLTVTTYEDGKTVLQWDDDILLAEVRSALLKAESVLPVTEVKPKKKTEKKTKILNSVEESYKAIDTAKKSSKKAVAKKATAKKTTKKKEKK